MKKILPFFLLLFLAGSCIAANNNKSKAKHKKTNTHASKKKAKTKVADYTGPLLKVADSKSETPGMAGFMVDGYYKLTVMQTATPAIHVSGAEQPTVHVCVEGAKKGSCIEDLGNGYGNMHWEANASTKSYISAYKPDGTRIPVKKDYLNGKKAWKGNEFVWEDDQYKVRVTVSKCKVMPNGVAICK